MTETDSSLENLPMLYSNSDGTVRAMCGLCMAWSPAVASVEALVELGWEMRPAEQTWCLWCSFDRRSPQPCPTQRGVVKRRKRPKGWGNDIR